MKLLMDVMLDLAEFLESVESLILPRNTAGLRINLLPLEGVPSSHKPADPGRFMEIFLVVASFWMTMFWSSVTNLPTLVGSWTLFG